MPQLLRVDKLIELLKSRGKPELATVDFDDKVERAIEIMIENDFSQLPVVKKGKTIGIITFGSIVRTMFHTEGEKRGKRTINILKCKVGDSTEKVSMKSYDEDLFNLIDTLAKESFVLVTTKEGKIEIITNYDILTYFRELTESFLILNDIENCLKQIVRAKFDESAFREKAKTAFTYKNYKKVDPPQTLDELNLGDYMTFISSNWREFDASLGSKSVFVSYLDKTRKIRNKACHFRGLVNSLDKEFIKFVLNYLDLRARVAWTWNKQKKKYSHI